MKIIILLLLCIYIIVHINYKLLFFKNFKYERIFLKITKKKQKKVYIKNIFFFFFGYSVIFNYI